MTQWKKKRRRRRRKVIWCEHPLSCHDNAGQQIIRTEIYKKASGGRMGKKQHDDKQRTESRPQQLSNQHVRKHSRNSENLKTFKLVTRQWLRKQSKRVGVKKKTNTTNNQTKKLIHIFLFPTFSLSWVQDIMQTGVRWCKDLCVFPVSICITVTERERGVVRERLCFWRNSMWFLVSEVSQEQTFLSLTQHI